MPDDIVRTMTQRPADGDLVLLDVNARLEFARISYDAIDHISVETLSGATIGGRFVDTVNGMYLLASTGLMEMRRAGTFIPGYASAVEHFEQRDYEERVAQEAQEERDARLSREELVEEEAYQRDMELEEREKNKDLGDWLGELNEIEHVRHQMALDVESQIDAQIEAEVDGGEDPAAGVVE